MKLNYLSISLVAFFLFSCGTSQRINKNFAKDFGLSLNPSELSIPDVDEKYYLDCVNIIEEGDPYKISSIDFFKFRCSYLKLSNKIEFDFKLEDELGKYFAAGDWEKVVEISDKILSNNQTRIRAHMLKGDALGRMNISNIISPIVGSGLINSILESGNGESTKTAFYVTSVYEEYDVLKMLGLNRIQVTTISENGTSYDVLLCNSMDGKQYEVYFDYLTIPLTLSGSK